MSSKYAQICPVHFGKDAIEELGTIVKDLKVTRVLVVSDPVVSKTKGYAKGIESLKAADIAVFEFNKIVSDPVDTLIDEGGKFARDNKVDGIVAIGGGSSMDAAKGINVLVNNDGPINQWLVNPFFKPGVPLLLVPTTSGTGSENTVVGVITDTQKGIKSAVIVTATAALIDPALTLEVPSAVTANTGMDVMAQAAESLTSGTQNPLSTVLAADSVKRVIQWLPVAVRDGANYQAREELAIASNFTGIAFNDASVHLGHAIAHILGAKLHLTHGNLCALALPEVLRYAATAVPERVRLVGEAANVALYDTDSDADVGEKVAAAIRCLARTIGIPSFAKLGIARADLVALAPLVRTDNCFNFIPRPLTDEEVATILGDMYDNYQ